MVQGRAPSGESSPRCRRARINHRADVYRAGSRANGPNSTIAAQFGGNRCSPRRASLVISMRYGPAEVTEAAGSALPATRPRFTVVWSAYSQLGSVKRPWWDNVRTSWLGGGWPDEVSRRARESGTDRLSRP